MSRKQQWKIKGANVEIGGGRLKRLDVGVDVGRVECCLKGSGSYSKEI